MGSFLGVGYLRSLRDDHLADTGLNGLEGILHKFSPETYGMQMKDWEKDGEPASFASLLIGPDDTATDSRVAAFAKQYQEALGADVKSRLPKTAPVVAAPVPQRARRGIQRLR